MPLQISPWRLAQLTAVVIAVPAAAGAATRVDRALAVAPNFVAHQICSGVFVGAQAPETYYREAVAPSLSVLAPLVRYRVDRSRSEVTASLWGIQSRARYRGAQGCLVVQGGHMQAPIAEAAKPPPPLLPEIAGPDVVATGNPALAAAIDRAFVEPATGPARLTKSVVIVHDGRIVAERYAPGVGVDTPQLGWSMTKSVTNALLGVLVRQGRIDMTAPAPVAAWRDPGDPRHAITPDHLLRMTSGLDYGQSLTQNWRTAFDPTAQLVFAKPDMAGLVEKAPLAARPGEEWRYANGNTLLLSRMIRDAAGGDGAEVTAFARRELFDKLGMTGVTLELDAVGTPIGASHMWAPARDWARLGMLYLDDGVVGGERILPAGWADYSAKLTSGSEQYGYGAGFWTNRGGSVAARDRRGAMPADSYFMRGSLGQYVVIVPSARLVIVRTGLSRSRYEDMDAVARLTAETIAALAPTRAASSPRTAAQTGRGH